MNLYEKALVLYFTYEELKLKWDIKTVNFCSTLYFTYEELKHKKIASGGFVHYLYTLPMRN